MSNQVVKVKREAIAAVMTCPLCHKLLREATAISECLHTFCRRCIYKKLSDEEWECCPICQIDLGCVPLEKLRPDHNLQDVRAKIFPYKRLKVNAPEISPSVTYPARRKERSLSSLVVSTPRVSTQVSLTGRRSKSRKPLRGSSFSIGKKEGDSAEDRPESSGSPETECAQNLRQNSSSGEPSGRSMPDKELKNGAEPWDANVDLWDPLNCLVEVANRSKSSKFLPQGSAAKSEPLHYTEKEGQTRKKFNEAPTLESGRLKKVRKARPKKAPAFAEFNVSPQAVLDRVSAKFKTRNHPICFSLVASTEPEGDSSLPQIPPSYLRVETDHNLRGDPDKRLKVNAHEVTYPIQTNQSPQFPPERSSKRSRSENVEVEVLDEDVDGMLKLEKRVEHSLKQVEHQKYLLERSKKEIQALNNSVSELKRDWRIPKLPESPPMRLKKLTDELPTTKSQTESQIKVKVDQIIANRCDAAISAYLNSPAFQANIEHLAGPVLWHGFGMGVKERGDLGADADLKKLPHANWLEVDCPSEFSKRFAELKQRINLAEKYGPKRAAQPAVAGCAT